VLAFAAALTTACQAAEAPSPTPFGPTIAAAPPTIAFTAVPLATATATPDTIQPTPTSPVPTPTSAPLPSPTPLPPPEPTLYTVQPGDTLLGIAEEFNVTLEDIAYANGHADFNDFGLIAGTEIQIPLCQAYQIMPGNTLAGISQVCGLTLDDLITANIAELALLGTLDAVPVSFVLVIPQESLTPEDLDCGALPAREQVIEYTPQPGAGIFCLSQKFGVSTATIMQANIERLSGGNRYGELPLLIPPVSGAVYVVSAGDIATGVTLVDLADWYQVPVETISDWNGNPVTATLREGLQLYLPDANLNLGPFVSAPAGE
jgi:LysM repeat protein